MEEHNLSLKFSPITKYTPKHYELLLEADPSLKSIASYLSRCESFELTSNHQSVGIIAIMATESQTIEIMNIAVHPKFQGKGLGTKLIQSAIKFYSTNPSFEKITIMTGTTSFGALYLYQKLGFRCKQILSNHFINPTLYPHPLHENGLTLKDAIMLERTL
ncbi:GNAT family N-acetyltransferase [Pediococcus stilesii]|uniref:GNAT family N-acetyltransferase n=1 Tax=Pediococcus stilesii TaxID=331679 RepID=A0A5R9BX24_9LACO|nr:GNAT family N-acetyltransferase [Pediococcus stilesii]